MQVTYRLIACAALCFVGTASMGSAQDDPLSYSYDRSTGGRPAATALNDNTSGVRPPVATGQKKSGVQEGRPPPIYPTNPLKRYHLPTALNYPSAALNHPSTPSNYQSSALNIPVEHFELSVYPFELSVNRFELSVKPVEIADAEHRSSYDRGPAPKRPEPSGCNEPNEDPRVYAAR